MPALTLDQYSAFVRSRAKFLESSTMDLLHGAVGVSGEAGELLDGIKKAWVYNKPLDRENILEEVGDALFYLQHICNVLDAGLLDVLEKNVAKLEKRYPSGYSDAAAQARADKPAGE